ncbi:MAG: Zn-ribbon domain-containing OB-fold protein [bacterium]
MEETRRVRSSWDLTAYKWKIESGGFELLKKGFKEKKILGVKCHRCGTVYVPGVDYCRKCFVDISEVVEAADRGRVTTFTVNIADIRGNLLEERTVPCTVQLDGSDSVINGRIQGMEGDRVRVGMPVRVVWREKTEGALADIECFEPV